MKSLPGFAAFMALLSLCGPAQAAGYVSIADPTNPSYVACVTSSGNLCVTPSAGSTIGVIPGTSGGLSVKSFIVAANTTSVAVDASPGQIYGIAAYGIAASTPVWVKTYNASQGSTTCGSGTPVERHLTSTASAGAGVAAGLFPGVAYSTAITVCVTAGIADNDTTAPAASSYVVNVYYK